GQTAPASVKGHVVDEAGQPLAKVHVYAPKREHGGGGWNASTPQAYTDADGAYCFSIPDVADFSELMADPEFHGGFAHDWRTPEELNLKAGETTEINFKLVQLKRVRI